MKEQKKRLQLLALVVFLVAIKISCIHLVNGVKFSLPNKNLYKIEIRNGTNGKLYVLEGEDALTFSDKLSDINAEVTRLSGWSSGYQYKIKIFNESGSDEIVIKSESSFIYGFHEP